MWKPRLAVCVVLAGCIFDVSWGSSGLGDGEYCLPLAGKYAIHREDPRFARSYSRGEFRLVELTTPDLRVSLSFRPVVGDIAEVAVVNGTIVGRTHNGYFVLDSKQPDAIPILYDTPEEWQAGLRGAGIEQDVRLVAPDAMAMALPEQAIRPWKFGPWGVTWDMWSVVAQISGLAIACVLGTVIRSGCLMVVMAVVMGLVTNVVAQIILGEAGPGAAAGFVVYPVLFPVTVSGVNAIARMIGRRSKIRTGANLQGNRAGQ